MTALQKKKKNFFLKQVNKFVSLQDSQFQNLGLNYEKPFMVQ